MTDRAMREVLLALAMTSNGRVGIVGGSGARMATSIEPRLGHQDAPQLFYARLYDRAETDEERHQVLERARAELHAITHAPPRLEVRDETREERDARIVRDGAGLPAQDVAVAMRCGVRDVRRARVAAGRDPSEGHEPQNGHALSRDERQAKVRELAAAGVPGRSIATKLSLSYSTVRRDLNVKR